MYCKGFIILVKEMKQWFWTTQFWVSLVPESNICLLNYVSVSLRVGNDVCVHVYLHLPDCVSFIFNLIKILHQNPSRGGFS